MVINKEIELYKQVSEKVSLQKVWDVLGATPHGGQKPTIDEFDNNPLVNSYCIVLGRRSGKSFGTSTIVLRELLIPYSNTILLSPSYKNSKIMFDEVILRVHNLKLPIKSINKGSFFLELENGAKFTSVTQTNVESALGSRLSLLVVDETQSISNLEEILDQLLTPMALDYGVKDNGVLYANFVFLGTPRGTGTYFHELFLREETRSNWKSFQSPSSCNPMLPLQYIQDQEHILPKHIYQQEILAQWVSTGSGVMYNFNKEINVYPHDSLTFEEGSKFICGFDFGTQDSTSMVLIYVDNSGNYFVHDEYMENMRTTKEHVDAFKAMEKRNKGQVLARFGDPSAAQTLLDLRVEHNYDISKAFNRIAEGVDILNRLLAPQGMNKKPKLYISDKCTELITQMQLITYNENKTSRSNDPFKKHKEHHFDAMHSARYCIATHYRQELRGETVLL